MTVSVQNTAITNTFDFWRTQTNYLAAAMSNQAVTVNSNTAVGNAAITGTMTANLFSGNISATNASFTTINATSAGIVTITANTTNTVYLNTSNVVVNSSISVGVVSINTNYIALGNSTVNVQISTPNSTQISNGSYYLNANSAWSVITNPYNPATNGSVTTSGTTLQLIDYYPMATFKTVEYTINVNDNTANNHYASKILTTHDGTVGYSTEYGQITTNTAVGTFSVTANATSVLLNFTPVSTGTTVKFTRVNV